MNLKTIRDNCWIDEVTGCWEWRGGLSRGRAGSRLPTTCCDGKTASVPRIVLRLLGKPLGKGQKAYRTCHNQLCVAPAHVVGGAPKEVGAILAASNRLKGNPAKAAKRAAVARAASKLTTDDVIAIRASAEPVRVLAERYGVGRACVYKVRSGETWGPIAGASVFARARAF